jgi:hypothetical protein
MKRLAVFLVLMAAAGLLSGGARAEDLDVRAVIPLVGRESPANEEEAELWEARAAWDTADIDDYTITTSRYELDSYLVVAVEVTGGMVTAHEARCATTVEVECAPYDPEEWTVPGILDLIGGHLGAPRVGADYYTDTGVPSAVYYAEPSMPDSTVVIEITDFVPVSKTDEVAKLEAARERWLEAGITDYDMSVAVRPPYGVSIFDDIEVRDGDLSVLSRTCSAAGVSHICPGDLHPAAHTVEGLFGIVAEKAAEMMLRPPLPGEGDGRVVIQAVYDPATGRPLEIRYHLQDVYDADVRISSESFEAVER